MNSVLEDRRAFLYVQLADLFQQRIRRGVWPVGTRLPSLRELTREFNVARVTARQAMEVLVRKGLVSPQRGRGTFVIATEKAERWMRVETTLKKLADNYRQLKPEVVNIAQDASQPVLFKNDGAPADKYFHVLRVHFIQRVPYCVISIYLDDRIFRKAPRRFRKELIIPLLLELPGIRIARASQTLTISTADLETAKHLRIPVNAPTAEVRRVFNGADGKVIYVAEVTYRGDFIRLEMNLKP